MNDYYVEDLFTEVPRQTPEMIRRFYKFHQENPGVYAGLVNLAREYRARKPDSKLGVANLYEKLRWDINMETTGDQDFRLCNDFKALYARLIMNQEPDLDGIFNIKRSVADLEPALCRHE